jgi:adenylylsulfate kinase
MTYASSAGFTLWLTGPSGTGKSTLAQALRPELEARGLRVEILDGDAVRPRLSQGLGYSRADRNLNVERIGFVAGLLARNGVAVIVAAISPYREGRALARTLSERFAEVHVDTSLDTLLQRDPKGLYARAIRGEIPRFTLISDPYEAPEDPEIRVPTEGTAVNEGVTRVLSWLERRAWLSASSHRERGEDKPYA